MTDTQCVSILSDRHGHGCVCFFDEPFGDQVDFALAGGYSVTFDNGITAGGPIAPEDLALGLDGWLARNEWRRAEEPGPGGMVKTSCVGEGWGV